MFTLYGALKTLFLTKNLSNFLLTSANFVLYILTLVIFAKRSKREKFDEMFSASLVLTIFFSLHALVHDLVILLVPIFIFLNKLAKKTLDLSSYKGLVVLFFLLPLIILFNITLPGVILLFLIGYYLVFKPSKKICI